MATIQLNLELSDEQYKGLMENSLDKVVGDEETIKALRDTITTQMADYLTKHSDIIKGLFYDHNDYGWETGVNGTTKAVVNKAAEAAAKQIEGAVTSYMVDLVKQQDISALLTHILMTAVLNGAVSGLKDWREEITNMTNINASNIRSVQERLNMAPAY